jgi:hypothetical protein
MLRRVRLCVIVAICIKTKGGLAFKLLRSILSLIGFFAVAPLLFLAWTGWAKQRADLVPWRNGFSLAALLLISLNWLLCAGAQVPDMVGLYSLESSDLTNAMFTLSHPLALVGIALGLAMRNSPRILITGAALLMLISTSTGYG